LANDDLAVTLSILRTIRRWSQSELAEAAGVTNSAISDYERGKVDPQSQTLQKLVRALGLPLSALDQTQAFIQMIRAQMDPAERVEAEGSSPPSFSYASTISPQEREIRAEIAQLASEGGRFASRLTRMILELLALKLTPTPLSPAEGGSASSTDRLAQTRQETPQTKPSSWERCATRAEPVQVTTKGEVPHPLEKKFTLPPSEPKREPEAPPHHTPPPPMGAAHSPERLYFQELVKRWADSLGYSAVVAEEIPGSGGNVDVALRTGDLSIACEVSLTSSTVEEEVGNVVKCLEAGFEEVAILCQKRSRLAKIRTTLKTRLSAAELTRVHVVSLEEFFDMLSRRQPTEETMVGQYKVKVRYKELDPAEAAARSRRVAEILARSLLRTARSQKA
jgi:transcriptional regulator with XRE-family HTH domain